MDNSQILRLTMTLQTPNLAFLFSFIQFIFKYSKRTITISNKQYRKDAEVTFAILNPQMELLIRIEEIESLLERDK